MVISLEATLETSIERLSPFLLIVLCDRLNNRFVDVRD